MKKIIIFVTITAFLLSGFSANAEGEALSLNTLNVGGEPVADFSTDTEARDFYYGVVELPDDTASLPAVEATGNGDISYESEFELGGFVTTVTLTDGISKEEYRIHFREIKSVTATADFIARKRYAYYEDSTASGYAGILNTSFGYLSFTFDKDFSQNCKIVSSSLSAYFNGAAGENMYVGFSGYSTKANLAANAASVNIDMLSSAGDIAFDEIGVITPNANLSAEVFSLPDIADENIAGSEILLVLGKNTSANTTYIWNTTARPAALTVYYVEKDINVDDNITLTNFGFKNAAGAALENIAVNDTVNASFTLGLNADAADSEDYTAMLILYNNGKIAGSDVKTGTLAPGEAAEISHSLLLDENPVNTSAVVLVWRSAESMVPLITAHYFFNM